MLKGAQRWVSGQQALGEAGPRRALGPELSPLSRRAQKAFKQPGEMLAVEGFFQAGLKGREGHAPEPALCVPESGAVCSLQDRPVIGDEMWMQGAAVYSKSGIQDDCGLASWVPSMGVWRLGLS